MRGSSLQGIVLIACAVFSMSAQDLIVDVNLQMLDAVVEDARGNPVLDLTADDFEILENGRPRPVKHLSIEGKPIVVGLVVDRSASVKPVKTEIDKAVARVVETLRPDDRVFLTTFAGTGKLSARLTTSHKEVLAALRKAQFGFGTRFYDVMAESLDYISALNSERKMLIVFGDGADHYSSHTFEQLRVKVLSADVPIYFLPYVGDDSRTASESGRLRIRHEFEQLAAWSGGEAFFPKNAAESARVAGQMLPRIQHHYRLGFYSSESSGGLSEVEVNVRRPGCVVYLRQPLVQVLP